MSTSPKRMCSPDVRKSGCVGHGSSCKTEERNLYGMSGGCRTRLFCIYRLFGQARSLMLLPFVLLLFLLSSCKDNTVYHVYRAIPEDSGWRRGDSLVFFFPSGLSPDSYLMEVGVRNTGGYKYRDLWLVLSQSISDTLPPRIDTLHLFLADKKGRWNRGGSAGSYYQSVFVSDKPFVIGPDSFHRSLRIVHIMRDNPLVGISDIGVRLSRKE